jgi:putative transposase
VFSLSLRDVELLLAKRGIIVSYETIHRWCDKFGAAKGYREGRATAFKVWHQKTCARTAT